MNMNEKKYSHFALVKEMMETGEIVRKFSLNKVDATISAIKGCGRLFFTGEGSSRIFPAKNAMAMAMRHGLKLHLATDGARQAAEYDLSEFAVFGASNSGQTKEIICLFDKLKKAGHKSLFGLIANKGTKLESLSTEGFVLSCGAEQAVAATKSVAEQGLFYYELLSQLAGKTVVSELSSLADKVNKALTLPIPAEMVKAIANAGTIYFAGRNDGVAEELTLKTNEITRKKSDFLEGTYAVHGIEEVMNPDDVVILIDPFEMELGKIKETLSQGVGMKVFAMSSKDTIFPTIKVPAAGELSNFVYLTAGWNILVEVGVHLGINLDKPQRARKVGNEFEG